ncbi:MAG: DUF3575 domain-containing protein [Bradymonadaceae bacterium]|nr:DUF3575 domain-containing protein [Lujinxingiaceae bacterium]
MKARACLLMILLFASADAFASSPEEAAPDAVSWTVQVDPLTTALGFVHVQLEYAWSDSISTYVGPHLRLYSGILPGERDEFLGLGAEFGLRYFLLGKAPEGLWLSARAVGAHLSVADETALGGYASGLVGHTWIFASRWVLSGGAGVQYLHYAIGDLGSKGIFPALHTTFGVAW